MFENLGAKLHDLVMEPDTNKPVKPDPVKATTGPSAPSGQAFTATTTTPINNQYVDALRAVIKNRSTALTALTAAAEKLVNVIPDPTVRLKAAFEMVKGDGRGVKELLDAINVHAADLESQKLQFGRAMEQESQKAVGVLQAESDGLSSGIQTAQQQIQSLQAQLTQLNNLISTNTARRAEIAGQISGEKARIDTNAQQFETALSIVKNELAGQRAVIQSALS